MRRLRTRSQSEACLFFCDSAGGGINIKHVGNALTSSYFGKIRENALTAGIRRVSGSFSETESRCLDSSVALLPEANVLTFPPPDLGMLRRSRRVLIFPKSRCIIYFDLRVPDYSNWS